MALRVSMRILQRLCAIRGLTLLEDYISRTCLASCRLYAGWHRQTAPRLSWRAGIGFVSHDRPLAYACHCGERSKPALAKAGEADEGPEEGKRDGSDFCNRRWTQINADSQLRTINWQPTTPLDIETYNCLLIRIRENSCAPVKIEYCQHLTSDARTMMFDLSHGMDTAHEFIRIRMTTDYCPIPICLSAGLPVQYSYGLGGNYILCDGGESVVDDSRHREAVHTRRN